MSSWLRTAVSKAVEVGGKTNIRRAVRSIADSVSHQSPSNNPVVVDRIFHDRNVAKDSRSFKHAAKRLEEASVSCRGVERVQLLRRWLVALKEIDRLPLYNGDFFEDDDFKDSFRAPTIAYYYDSDDGGDPRNFRDVFLHSQALEGMVLSMILEAPNEEEVSLLMEIFRLCLTGKKEVHTAVMKSIQELAETFLSYEDEVLVKREELLQYAQDAIAGLKLSADLARVDAEAYSIKEDLDKMKELHKFSGEVEEKSTATTEDLKEALVQVQSFAKLEALLLRKKTLCNGDTPKLHAQKLDKLKVLLESLSNSTTKAEKRISEQRYQKEEALNFRISKASEMSHSEKDLHVEIQELQKKRDELEEELKKVNNSLSAAYARLQNSREEKEQFDEASNQILVLLKSKEDELSRAIASYKKEVNIVKTWIRFLEGTWVLQTSHTEQQEKEVDGELERYGSEFVSFVINLLSLYKSELVHSVSCIREVVNNLQSSQGSELEHENDNEKAEPRKLRKDLEQELVEAETKFLTTSSVVDAVRKHFYAQNEGVMRKDEQKVKELFDVLEKIKDDFESIERPTTRNDTQSQRSETTSDDRVLTHSFSDSEHGKQTSDHIPDDICALAIKAKQVHIGSEYTLDKGAKPGNMEYENTSDNEEEPGNLESNTLGKEEKSGNMESRHLDNDVKKGYPQSEYKLEKVAKQENIEYEHTLEKELERGNMETSTLEYEEKSGNLDSEYVLEEEAESGNEESKTLDNEGESGNLESDEGESGNLESEYTFENEAKPRNLESNTSGNEEILLKLESEYTLHNEAERGILEFNALDNEAESEKLESEYALDSEAKPENLDSEYVNINRESLLDKMDIPTRESARLSDHKFSVSPSYSLEQAIGPAEHDKEVNKCSSFDEEKSLDAREKPGNLVAELLETSNDSAYDIETTSQSLPGLYDDKTSISPVPTPQHTSQTSEHGDNEYVEFSSIEEEKPLDSREKPEYLVAELQKISSGLAVDRETTSQTLPALYDDKTSISPVPTPQHTPQTSEHREKEFAEFFLIEEEKPLNAQEKLGNMVGELQKTSNDSADDIGTTNQSLPALYDDKTSFSPVPTPQHTPQTSQHGESEFVEFFSIEEEKPLDSREKPGNLVIEQQKTSNDLAVDIETTSQSFPALYDDKTYISPVSTPQHTPQTSEHTEKEFAEFFSIVEEKPLNARKKRGDLMAELQKTSSDSADDIETTSQGLSELYDDMTSISPVPTPQHTPQTPDHREYEFAEFFSMEEEKPLDARQKPGDLEAYPGKTYNDSMDGIGSISQSLQALHDDKTSTSPVLTPQHSSQTSGDKRDEFAKVFLIEEEKLLDATEKTGHLEARSGMTCNYTTDEIGTTNQSLHSQYDDKTSATPVYTPLNTPQTSEHEQYEFADFYSSEEDMEKPEYMDSEPGKISTDSLIDDTENRGQKLPATSDDRIHAILLNREHNAETNEHEKGEIPVDSLPENNIMVSLTDDAITASQKIQETADDKISLNMTNTEHTTKTYQHGEDKVARPSVIKEDKEASGSVAKHEI